MSAAASPAELHVVAPYWLDRPDEEALAIAEQALRDGYRAMWLGEMATFDAFALASAVGMRAPGLALKVGPLAIGVRSPVALALGVASVATLTGAHVDLALGASSPAIVSAWHDRPWNALAPRARETVAALRPILAGERADYAGAHVRTHGFRLRSPQPDTKIGLAAFGPAMTRVAAAVADEVVLNLVTPEHVARVRAVVDGEAAARGRPAPEIAVWVSAALDPGPLALAQMAAQIAVYLQPPGYGEMFAELGFGELVQRARSGGRRAQLAQEIPVELLRQVCAIGSAAEIAERLARYGAAGATAVGVAPATAEDPAGARVLSALR